MKETDMDYERIEKRSLQGNGGGLSPRKLRSMILGVEKRRNLDTEEELESTFSLRSQATEIDDSGNSGSENCKDVDVVSVIPESSTSITAASMATEMVTDSNRRDHSLLISRIRSQNDSYLDDGGEFDSMNVSSNVFEFQKAEKAAQRVPIAPFSKPAPSKWDDAQKWIASPTSNRPKTMQPVGQGGQVVGSRKVVGCGSRHPLSKVVMEVPDQKFVPFEEPHTKWIDSSQDNKDIFGQHCLTWESDPYPDTDSYGKPELMIENSGGQSAINLSRHDSSMSLHSATFIPPPSTARSVSMRDMGTEMTPIASQEPSRTGTPIRATTPMRSPASSRSTTPRGAVRSSSPTGASSDRVDHKKEELSEKEMQMRTRREIIRLGTQLGKMNIAAWASKEEEDNDASTSLKTVGVEQAAKNVIETRATAWEEAEKAKYIARFKREEIKIQAWENHQKAKAEAEMRKMEVEVERMRGKLQEKLMNKIAAASHKAEEKRAAADAQRNRQAAKTEQQVDYIRRTGRTPSPFWRCGWCS